jgi:hypothetical protein
MSCRAVAKADSLAAFVRRRGAPLKDYAVTLTVEEAWELLDFIGSGGMGVYADQYRLIADIEAARSAGDPWSLLAYFQIAGMEIQHVRALH